MFVYVQWDGYEQKDQCWRRSWIEYRTRGCVRLGYGSPLPVLCKYVVWHIIEKLKGVAIWYFPLNGITPELDYGAEHIDDEEASRFVSFLGITAPGKCVSVIMVPWRGFVQTTCTIQCSILLREFDQTQSNV